MEKGKGEVEHDGRNLDFYFVGCSRFHRYYSPGFRGAGDPRSVAIVTGVENRLALKSCLQAIPTGSPKYPIDPERLG